MPWFDQSGSYMSTACCTVCCVISFLWDKRLRGWDEGSDSNGKDN